MNDIARTLGSALTFPITAGLSMLHDWATGKEAILDVPIEGGEDLFGRQQLVDRLRRVAANPQVVGVLFRLRKAPGSWAACQDLRATMAHLREKGTPVYAWVEGPDNALMWIASAADRIFVPPTSEVSLVGVGVEMTFFGQALSRLGIQPDFEAAGAYKSFGEPWTRSFASPENQEAVSALVRDLHRQLLDDIGSDRDLDDVAQLVEQAPLPAPDALAAGLVDECLYPDQLREWLEEIHGKSCRMVSWSGFSARQAALDWTRSVFEGGDTVVVLHMDGSIVLDGPKSARQIRAHDVLPILRLLRKEDRVKAVVLHVNSPGGSALASDLMWREVEQIREEKPVVAVFEDVAASGGYYLSAPASEIVARSATLTGSIGVFGGKLVVSDALRRLGITTQEVSESPNATMLSPTKRFTDEQRKRFRASLQRFYDGFVERVASGRQRSEDEIEPHCRGRVWTGEAAKIRGLVDRHGDVYDGIERARVLADLPPTGWKRRDLITWKRRTIVQKAVQNAIRGGLGPSAEAGVRILKRLGLAELSDSLHVLLEHEGQVMAMLPWEIRGP